MKIQKRRVILYLLYLLTSILNKNENEMKSSEKTENTVFTRATDFFSPTVLFPSLIIALLIYNLAIVQQSMPWLHWDPGKINEPLVPSVHSPKTKYWRRKRKKNKEQIGKQSKN
jgi:hypothetical protein